MQHNEADFLGHSQTRQAEQPVLNLPSHASQQYVWSCGDPIQLIVLALRSILVLPPWPLL